MSSYLDKTGLERVWSKATDKFATIATTDELKGNIETLTSTKADKTEVETAVAGLVDSAPETLNTLNELAAALGDDPNFATTIATEVGKKVNSSEYNDAIAGINANIASITPEKIGALNKEEYLGPVVLEGNPIVYESGTEGLGIAAVSYLEPKQEGSGDPYPAGGGKNLFNYDAWKTVNIERGTAVWENNGVTITSNEADCFTGYGSAYPEEARIPVSEGNTYVLSWEESSNKLGNVYIFPNGSSTGMVNTNNSREKKLVYTATSGIFFLVLRFGVSNAGETIAYKNIQIEKGSAPTAFQPYSNIRPFIGYDKLDLSVAGKNLFDFKKPRSNTSGITYKVDGDTVRVYTFSEGTWRGLNYDYVTLKAGVKYTFSIDVLAYTSGYMYYGPRRRSNNVFMAACTATKAGHYTSTVTPSEDVEVYMALLVTNDTVTTGDITFANAQIAIGSETAYAPYHNKLHTVQIGQTVYGGKVDWNTGKLVAEWGFKEFDGSESFGMSETGVVLYTPSQKPLRGSSGIGSHHSRVECGNSLNIHDALNATDLDTWTAFVTAQKAAGTPVQVAYKLATPIEIQLTPTQISELEGINTLYGDGSNIRAIFNTTGSASPVLESISGILPVEKGGTGSMNAAGARNNLGITPENIGALGNSGRQKIADGTLVVGNRNGNASNLDLYTDDTNTTLRFLKDGENNTNNLSLYEEYTILGKPLTVSSGGTGASDAATARANLGITPANIGALPTTGGTVTGPFYVLRNKNNFAYVDVKNIIDDVEHVGGFTIGTDGVLFLRLAAGGTTINSMQLTSATTVFAKPVTVSSGGTGANNAATARSNLGITPANIGAAPTSHASTATTYGAASASNYGHAMASSTTPKANGTAAVGSETAKFARGDHVHPLQTSVSGSSGSCTGNAATATTLSATLAIGKGGTGITSNPSMLVNLGSTSAASVFAASPRPGITGTLAIGNGGTGATSKSGARTNLGITSGTSLPASATAGDIFFLYS